MVAQEGAPSLTWRSMPLGHVSGHRRLGDFKAKLKQLAVNARGTPTTGSPTLIRRISARNSVSICGRPPRERDFQRQYRRKPARCQRTSVSGRITVMTFRTDGNHRYSWIKNMRSLFVSRTRLCTIRRNSYLVTERSILGFKSALRLKWRHQDVKDKT